MKKANILIVEDDINISKMIATILDIGGYSSICCYDGKNALDLLNNLNSRSFCIYELREIEKAASASL